MKRCALLLTTFFFLFSSLVTAESKIYHWVDEQGKNHFSDTVEPGVKTEEINVRNQNLLLNSQQENSQRSTGELQIEIGQQRTMAYQATITSPTDDTAIRSNNGTLDIQVAIVPEKENNQKLQLFLDGSALGKPQISSTIRALNVDRGTHQAQVHLLDENGELLATTQIVTVHLQRATINTADQNKKAPLVPLE